MQKGDGRIERKNETVLQHLYKITIRIQDWRHGHTEHQEPEKKTTFA